MPAKQRVLVVDDDQLVADTLSLIFAAHGFESQACYSAAEGLLCARSFHPSLLLCDVTMPEIDGLTLVATMAAEMPECRALLLTAFAENIEKVHQRSSHLAQPLRLLNKPCRPEALLQEVDALLASAAVNAPA